MILKWFLIVLFINTVYYIENGKTSFLTDKTKLWDNGVVPYTFERLDLGDGTDEPLFRDQDMQLILDAMSHISDKVPRIRFR